MASSTIADDGAKNGLNSGGINHLGDESIANSEPTMEGATAVNGGGLPVAPSYLNGDNEGFQEILSGEQRAEKRKLDKIARDREERARNMRTSYDQQELIRRQQQGKPKYDFNNYVYKKQQVAYRLAKEAASISKFKSLPLCCRVVYDGKNAKVSNTAILEALGVYFRKKLTEVDPNQEILSCRVAEVLSAAIVDHTGPSVW